MHTYEGKCFFRVLNSPTNRVHISNAHSLTDLKKIDELMRKFGNYSEEIFSEIQFIRTNLEQHMKRA